MRAAAVILAGLLLAGACSADDDTAAAPTTVLPAGLAAAATTTLIPPPPAPDPATTEEVLAYLHEYRSDEPTDPANVERWRQVIDQACTNGRDPTGRASPAEFRAWIATACPGHLPYSAR